MRASVVIAVAAAILLTGGTAVILSTGAARAPALSTGVTFDFEGEIAATDKALVVGTSLPDGTAEIRALRDVALQMDREARRLNRMDASLDEVQKIVWQRDEVMGRVLDKLGTPGVVKGRASSEIPLRAWYEAAWNTWNALPTCG
jgi:hypothetical protein